MNRVLITAQIIERKALRYTPAGLPALDLVLQHESEVTEAQLSRKVKLDIKAVAIGEIDAVIAPEDTRNVIVDSLAALRAKNDARPESPKKHDNIPL